jgi:DNA-binding GntR family transcriptional regulator
MAESTTEARLYRRLVKHVFSGELSPGEKVVERQLAEQLGVSRIPVRESLRKMVGQGLLTSGADGGEIRMREYSPEDVRQLYEFRVSLEVCAARAASRAATDTDVARMRLICDETDLVIEAEEPRQRWGELDHAFHEALAEASHNERISHSLKNLLTECHYLFYVFPAKAKRKQETPAQTAAHMREVLEGEHRALLKLIDNRDAEGAEELARETIRLSGQRLIEAMIASKLST